MTNTFSVQIEMPPKLISKFGDFDRDIDLHILSIQTPDFQNSGIEAFVLDRYFIQNSIDALHTFSITFRDHNNMALYRKFVNIYKYIKNHYFDDVALNIILTKEEDWNGQGDEILMTLEGTLIDSVSNLDFGNESENEIANFTVNFKTNNITVVK